MRSRWISLSRPRRVLGDMMHFASQVPSIPVQRLLRLGDVVAARSRAEDRPCWPAVLVKAYALVADEVPALRRAYVGLPWPHLREYPTSVANVAVERDFEGEPCVFLGRISDPGRRTLREVHSLIRGFAETPLESMRPFQKMLSFARLPRPLRRFLMWLGLNLPRQRTNRFGTFVLSVYSSLGAESLHPITPLTATLNYGVIAPDGSVNVRLIYDHRVFDGATAARALAKLEEVMNGPILRELKESTAARNAA